MTIDEAAARSSGARAAGKCKVGLASAGAASGGCSDDSYGGSWGDMMLSPSGLTSGVTPVPGNLAHSACALAGEGDNLSEYARLPSCKRYPFDVCRPLVENRLFIISSLQTVNSRIAR